MHHARGAARRDRDTGTDGSEARFFPCSPRFGPTTNGSQVPTDARSDGTRRDPAGFREFTVGPAMNVVLVQPASALAGDFREQVGQLFSHRRLRTVGLGRLGPRVTGCCQVQPEFPLFRPYQQAVRATNRAPQVGLQVERFHDARGKPAQHVQKGVLQDVVDFLGSVAHRSSNAPDPTLEVSPLGEPTRILPRIRPGFFLGRHAITTSTARARRTAHHRARNRERTTRLAGIGGGGGAATSAWEWWSKNEGKTRAADATEHARRTARF